MHTSEKSGTQESVHLSALYPTMQYALQLYLIHGYTILTLDIIPFCQQNIVNVIKGTDIVLQTFLIVWISNSTNA